MDLLENEWKQTDLGEGEARQIIARIDNILAQLPAAIKQAHERIIGGRRVANKDRTLSLYEPDINVFVRGKSGSEVEFGNTFLLAEQHDGVIVDWDLLKKNKSDSKLLKASLARFVQLTVLTIRVCRGLVPPSECAPPGAPKRGGRPSWPPFLFFRLSPTKPA